MCSRAEWVSCQTLRQRRMWSCMEGTSRSTSLEGSKGGCSPREISKGDGNGRAGEIVVGVFNPVQMLTPGSGVSFSPFQELFGPLSQTIGLRMEAENKLAVAPKALQKAFQT